MRVSATLGAERHCCTRSVYPVEQAILHERSQQVRQTLTQLSDRQRQAIELAYDAGLSQSEIAQQQ
ncbi:MAG: sigma factor-like helix-turn-helix DNA-binding protein [Nostoc sp. DedVER02]|uniref:sigma factor-like helix-turn-helix DNA-binding protein n=1 Tax=Nostoc sp. DedVER02 TaxID=3075405 RepID=UPI00391DAE59